MEDELQEHAGETARQICISKGPRHQIIKQGARACFYGEKNLKGYGRTRKFIHGGMNLRTTTVGNEHVPVSLAGIRCGSSVQRCGAGSGAFPAFFSTAGRCSGEIRGAGLGAVVRARGGEEANGVRKKKRPRSPINRGGAVTGACEAC